MLASRRDRIVGGESLWCEGALRCWKRTELARDVRRKLELRTRHVSLGRYMELMLRLGPLACLIRGYEVDPASTRRPAPVAEIGGELWTMGTAGISHSSVPPSLPLFLPSACLGGSVSISPVLSFTVSGWWRSLERLLNSSELYKIL